MALRLIRIDAVLDRSGDTRSPLYVKQNSGLFTKGIKIGGRAVAWPEHEVDALISARIAGKTDAEIRALVVKLHEARKTAALEVA